MFPVQLNWKWLFDGKTHFIHVLTIGIWANRTNNKSSLITLQSDDKWTKEGSPKTTTTKVILKQFQLSAAKSARRSNTDKSSHAENATTSARIFQFTGILRVHCFLRSQITFLLRCFFFHFHKRVASIWKHWTVYVWHWLDSQHPPEFCVNKCNAGTPARSSRSRKVCPQSRPNIISLIIKIQWYPERCPLRQM